MVAPTLSATAAGTPVAHHAELASTNVEAMRLATSGEAGPLWVMADVQTGGKGRSGRAWVGERGNLFASYLLTTEAPITRAHQLALVAGVAAFDAIAALGLGRDQGLRLKWPNDILIGTAKAGGILVESTSLPGRRDLSAVVGVGLNMGAHPDIAGREVTSLATQGCSVTPRQALEALDVALTQALSLWDAAVGFASVREAWIDRAGPLGERMTVHGAEGLHTGFFAGLDEDGALFIVLEDGERRRCTYGDVTLE
jgi:BirA family biotin operon repressor/biotin-[acetyl-CoA-carboxylase] ligase